MSCSSPVGLFAFLGPGRARSCRDARTLLGGKQYEAIANTDIRAEAIAASPDDPDPDDPAGGPGERARPARQHGVGDALVGGRAVGASGTCRPGGGADDDRRAGPVDDGDGARGGVLTGGRTDSLLRFTFREPTDIGRVEILAGRYDADKARALFSRPRVIELAVGDRCERYELLDKGSLQALNFAATDATQVELRIVDVYRGRRLGRHRRDLRGRLRTRTLTTRSGRHPQLFGVAANFWPPHRTVGGSGHPRAVQPVGSKAKPVQLVMVLVVQKAWRSASSANPVTNSTARVVPSFG